MNELKFELKVTINGDIESFSLKGLNEMSRESAVSSEFNDKELRLDFSGFKTSHQKCGECEKELKSEDEKNFGQCDECCAWKYRDCSR